MPGPDPQEELRAEVQGLLGSGFESGLLEQALMGAPEAGAVAFPAGDMLGTKGRLEDAAKEVEDLGKTVQELRAQLAVMEQENKELKGVLYEEDDELRKQAKSAFVSGLQTGKLQEALGGESELDALRRQAQETLLKSSKDGSLNDGLQKLAAGQPVEAKQGVTLMDGSGLVEGSEAVRKADGASGRVKQRKGKEVLVKMSDGTEAWYPVEELTERCMLAPAYLVEPGDDTVRHKDQAKGFVKMRTTTEVLVVMADGSEQWHAIEEIAHALPTADDLREGDEAIRVRDASKG